MRGLRSRLSLLHMNLYISSSDGQAANKGFLDSLGVQTGSLRLLARAKKFGIANMLYICCFCCLEKKKVGH